MDTVLENRKIRSIFSLLSPPLPCELVTYILDLAEKWHCTVSLSIPHASPPLCISQSRSTRNACGDHILLSSPFLTRQDVSQLRKITFTMTSRDQGWSSTSGSQGTYDDSWTWFDAVVLPPEDQHPPAEAVPHAVGECVYYGPPPYRHHVQHNRHAGSEMESYRVELWRLDGLGMFQIMKKGSRVAFVACARFPGWVNRVQDAGMEFWSAETGR